MLKLHPTLVNKNILNNPASYEFINSLKSFQVTEQFLKDKKNKNNCTICLAKLDLDEEVSKQSCEHTFHLSCIQFWLSKVENLYFSKLFRRFYDFNFLKSATCPICMKVFSQSCNQNCSNESMVIKRETLL